MKRTIAIAMTICLLMAGVTSGLSVYAESPEEWWEPYMEEAQKSGLVKEMDLQKLQEEMTREDFVKMVINLYAVMGGKTVEPSESSPFEDTENQKIIQAYELGIVQGVGNRLFDPSGLITREQMAVMLNRVMDALEIFPITTMEYILFDDEDEISDWAKSSVQLLYKVGVLTGVSERTIAPKNEATNQQGMVMAVRVMKTFEEYMQDEEVVSYFDNINLLMPTTENYMFSPISIQMALAMAAVGAEGETLEEILLALDIQDLQGFSEKTGRLIASYRENQTVQLNIANSIWLNQDHHYEEVAFSEAYKDMIETYYEGYGQVVNNDNAENEINKWVEEKTAGRITELVDNSDFLAFIANVIYFKGEWKNQFEEELTTEGAFTDREGNQHVLPFMNQTGYFDYFKDETLEMIRLPYVDDRTSMYLILSEDRPIDFIENTKTITNRYVELSLPKFEVEFNVTLNELLKDLGIQTAFMPYEADFKGMFTDMTENAFISAVEHKSFIQVDEAGTEATAVTGISVGVTSLPTEELISFKADKPFTFVVMDDMNGTVLFMGEYAFVE